ncbi:hypothetical protein P175DRAFT_0502149 [Aspergillus ochraceoroseus IBT 24754]|uniref:N-acetyltransferase domain-containing protein n=1 Tax=Aspergillus ochraceoroseus IBT 24754 TaxID=1392256 RepID=A0A2T5LUN4_9EURO|nr:uncharacterized protein P175DRAFT_0502149 [Aspergillus ochraceoroseus IBT 24754]PTU20002.1 hypothetical protein P175DRAFT_0502149 [Aspergillus ochraceoroseus IBT 24754]
MRFQIHEVPFDADDFEELIACEVASFDRPQQSIFRFFYPIFGEEPQEAKDVAFTNLVELKRQWCRDDPDALWLKVTDTEHQGKIVGGLLLKIHQTNPFARKSSKETSQSAVWYPAGSQREYIDECTRIFSEPYERYMQRPHVYLYIGFVLNGYRQAGLADLLLVAACQRADELGLEAWTEAVQPTSLVVNMRHGFIPYRKLPIEPTTETPDDEWLQMERKMQPLRFWPMWRPPSGKIVVGHTMPPWREFMTGMFSRL